MTRRLTVEIAGLPVAGKTTAAHHLRSLFSSIGQTVEVVEEAASISPFAQTQKLDWRFNAWTLVHTVAEHLRTHASSTANAVLFDRGLFDAECWIRWHRECGRLKDDEAVLLERFARFPPWFEEVDVVFVLRVEFRTAVRRRQGIQGQIVKDAVFRELLSVYGRAVRHLQQERGCEVHLIDTDALSPDDVITAMLSASDTLRATLDTSAES